MPRDEADKLTFEAESKAKAERDTKLAQERAEKEMSKKGKVFGHLSGSGTPKPSQPLPKQGVEER